MLFPSDCHSVQEISCTALPKSIRLLNSEKRQMVTRPQFPAQPWACLITTLVQVLHKPEQSGDPAVMPGILHLGCTGMRRDLGGNEQELQPTNPDGMVYDLLRFARSLGCRFRPLRFPHAVRGQHLE